MENDLVVFRTFDNALEANIVMAKLADAEIPCFLKDEHFVGMNPIYSNAAGGIKLVIHQHNVPLANELLQQSLEIYQEEIRCRLCLSGDVHFVTSKKTKLNYLTVALSMLFGSYPLYLKKVYRCSACGHEFELE